MHTLDFLTHYRRCSWRNSSRFLGMRWRQPGIGTSGSFWTHWYSQSVETWKTSKLERSRPWTRALRPWGARRMECKLCKSCKTKDNKVLENLNGLQLFTATKPQLSDVIFRGHHEGWTFQTLGIPATERASHKNQGSGHTDRERVVATQCSLVRESEGEQIQMAYKCIECRSLVVQPQFTVHSSQAFGESISVWVYEKTRGLRKGRRKKVRECLAMENGWIQCEMLTYKIWNSLRVKAQRQLEGSSLRGLGLECERVYSKKLWRHLLLFLCRQR